MSHRMKSSGSSPRSVDSEAAGSAAAGDCFSGGFDITPSLRVRTPLELEDSGSEAVGQTCVLTASNMVLVPTVRSPDNKVVPWPRPTALSHLMGIQAIRVYGKPDLLEEVGYTMPAGSRLVLLDRSPEKPGANVLRAIYTRGEEPKPPSLWITIGMDGSVQQGTGVPAWWGEPQSC